MYIYLDLLSSREEVVGIRELEEEKIELEEGVIDIRVLEEDLIELMEII